MSYAQELIGIREQYGLSQTDVAKALGISRTTVGEIEKGNRDIELSELIALAQLIRSDVATLIADGSKPKPTQAKYREMLMQIALSYKRSTGKDIPKTFLAKLVYLIDFAWFYEQLEPMSGLAYRRQAYGPVADEYYTSLGELVEEGWLDAKHGRKAQFYSPLTGKAGDGGQRTELFAPQYLSVAERELIEKIVEKWKDADTEEIVAFTHAQLPWQICSPGEVIPYELITQEARDRVY